MAGRRPMQLVAAAAAIALLAACGSSGDDSAGSGPASSATRASSTTAGGPEAPAGPAPEGSAWAEVLDGISDDGTVGTDDALRAFALAFGALPGVDVPGGPAGDVLTGGFAARLARAHLGDMTAEQRAAVVQTLTGTPFESGGPGKTFTMALDVRQTIDELLTRYQGPLGKLPVPVKVVSVGAQGSAEAVAEGLNAQGDATGTAAYCRVGITPEGAQADASDLEMVLAHELFHCYQAVWLGLDRFYDDAAASPWVIEGAATWAGYNVAPTAPSDGQNWWFHYLATPGRMLFSRAHDAVGFYGELVHLGVDLWPELKAFTQAPGNAARYQMLTADVGGQLDISWAPSYFKSTGRGSAWTVEGKAVPPDMYANPASLDVAAGATVAVKAAPYTNAIAAGDPTADVTTFQFAGQARLADAAGFDSTELADLAVCTRSDGNCACPDDGGDGSDGGDLPESVQAVTGPLTLGVTGATSGAGGKVTGWKLDDWCKQRRKKTTTTTAAPVGTGPIDCARILPAAEVQAAVGVALPTPVTTDVPGGSDVSCVWMTGPGTGFETQLRDYRNGPGPLDNMCPGEPRRFAGDGFIACETISPGAGGPLTGGFISTRRGSVLFAFPLSVEQARKLYPIVARTYR